MQYLLLIYNDEARAAQADDAQRAAMMQAYFAYTDALRQAGALVSADRLKPTTTATTVRQVDGRSQVLDGPYAETREQLGGYYLIECETEEQAIDAAARCPGAKWGTVELRPIWEIPA